MNNQRASFGMRSKPRNLAPPCIDPSKNPCKTPTTGRPIATRDPKCKIQSHQDKENITPGKQLKNQLISQIQDLCAGPQPKHFDEQSPTSRGHKKKPKNPASRSIEKTLDLIRNSTPKDEGPSRDPYNLHQHYLNNITLCNSNLPQKPTPPPSEPIMHQDSNMILLDYNLDPCKSYNPDDSISDFNNFSFGNSTPDPSALSDSETQTPQISPKNPIFDVQKNSPLPREKNSPLLREKNSPLPREKNSPLPKEKNSPLPREKNSPLPREKNSPLPSEKKFQPRSLSQSRREAKKSVN